MQSCAPSYPRTLSALPQGPFPSLAGLFHAQGWVLGDTVSFEVLRRHGGGFLSPGAALGGGKVPAQVQWSGEQEAHLKGRPHPGSCSTNQLANH